MAQKSKAASLTGELLAPKGGAAPATPSPQQANGAGETETQSVTIDPVDGAAPDPEAANGGGIQFPLRLSPAAHLELRMASARSGLSCQDLIVEALARYLAEIAAEPGAAEPPRSGGPE